ncbi:MAG: type IX secretion system membrane protein PorP/SprF [Bacteroidota bacterium]
MTQTTISKAAKVVLTIVLFGVFPKVNAQYDAMFTQYMFNEMFINPAFAGSKEALAVSLHHRQQWVGFAGRPVTTTFTAHMPLFRNTMGVGLCFLSEKLGVLSRNLIYANYAYRVRLSGKSYLTFGVMGGAHLQSEKLAAINTVEPGDPNFSVNTPTVITPNFGFGIMYTTEKFYAGISVPRLLDDNIKVSSDGTILGNNKVVLNKFHYYATIGKVFVLGPNLKIVPQLMLKAVSNAPFQFDVNVNALMKERLWLGLSYRSRADISGLAGVYITPQLLLTYSYDYPLTILHDYTSGSHEIGISYTFRFKGKKVVSPRYFL